MVQIVSISMVYSHNLARKSGRKEHQSLISSHRMNELIGFRKSTSPQDRQHIVYCYQLKRLVDGFVGELTFYDYSMKILCEIRYVALRRFGEAHGDGGGRQFADT